MKKFSHISDCVIFFIYKFYRQGFLSFHENYRIGINIKNNIYIYIYIHIYLCAGMYVRVCLCVCVCVCVINDSVQVNFLWKESLAYSLNCSWQLSNRSIDLTVNKSLRIFVWKNSFIGGCVYLLWISFTIRLHRHSFRESSRMNSPEPLTKHGNQRIGFVNRS